LSSAVVTAAGRSNTDCPSGFLFLLIRQDLYIKELQQKEGERRQKIQAVQENEIKIFKGSWKHLQDWAVQYTASLPPTALHAASKLHILLARLSPPPSFFLYAWHFLLRSRCCTMHQQQK
jgi:hypothetical protein